MDELNAALDLYDPVILAYARNQERWREVHEAQHLIKAFNPVCGDKFEIRLDIDKVITDVSFFGYGCVVSKASTAILAEMLVGIRPEEARIRTELFIDVMNGRRSPDTLEPILQPFAIAPHYPGRMPCVLLAWQALLRSSVFLKL